MFALSLFSILSSDALAVARTKLFRTRASRVQEQLDIDRLFLLVRLLQHQLTTGKPANSSQISGYTAQCGDLPPDRRRQVVQDCLRDQVLDMAAAVHRCLEQAGDAMPAASAFIRAAAVAAEAAGGSGRGGQQAVPGLQQQQQQQQQRGSRMLSRTELSSALCASGGSSGGGLGFSLEVRPSGIRHPAAGRGTFVSAGSCSVPPGTLVALCPGLVYGPQHTGHVPVLGSSGPGTDLARSMLPAWLRSSLEALEAEERRQVEQQERQEVDRLLQQQQQRGQAGDSTVAGAIGAGGGSVCSGSVSQAALPRPLPDRTTSMYARRRWDGFVVDCNPWATGQQQQGGRVLDGGETAATGWGDFRTSWEAGLGLLEGRHPYAVGHLVNHPPAGNTPNVVAADVSFSLPDGWATTQPWLRAYLPNIRYHPGQGSSSRLWAKGGGGPPSSAGELLGETTYTGMCLVSCRPLAPGDELLVDYRLSPLAPRPTWYTSHAPHEEARRWSQPGGMGGRLLRAVDSAAAEAQQPEANAAAKAERQQTRSRKGSS